MRNYEALIVFNMKGTETPVEELISTVAAAMKEEGADITATENAGRREFAYESNHLSAGQYVTYTFSREPSAIRPHPRTPSPESPDSPSVLQGARLKSGPCGRNIRSLLSYQKEPSP
ncbi:MAG: 30S ribosomal protein S6 [Akkermansia sp.]